MNNIFAKIFEIEGGGQVLVTKNYDGEEDESPFYVKLETMADSFGIETAMEYDKEEDMVEAYEKFNKDDAKAFYDAMVDMFEELEDCKG